jgi:hypothetical protein
MIATGIAFIGTEVEGPYKGGRTLFLSKQVPYEIKHDLLQEHLQQITAVYLGAGEQRGMLPEDQAIIEWAHKKGLRITLEMDPATMYFDLEMVARSQVHIPGLKIRCVLPIYVPTPIDIKLMLPGHLLWMIPESGITTNLSEMAYHLDRKVWPED